MNKDFNMQTVLVTGAAGFIGSNIADRLLKDGHSVIGVDNLFTGSKENLSTHKHFKFYEFDLTNRIALDIVIRENHIDTILHLAGNASIVSAMTNPTADVQNNIVTTMNVVNACIDNKVSRLLHASTMVVYGQDNVNKIETDACVPTSTYGLTKYAGERYVMNAGARTDLGFNLDVTAFRMFNVYGPKQDLNNPYQGVVAIFVGATKSKKTITIHGTGEQTRDFIYIDDVVDAWVEAIDEPKTYNQVFNLGSGKDYSINYILDKVVKEMDKDTVFGTTIYRNSGLRQGDITRCVSNSKKLQKALKWKPKVSFDDGVMRFMNYVRGK